MACIFFQRSWCTASKLASTILAGRMQAAAAHGSCPGLQLSRQYSPPHTQILQRQSTSLSRQRLLVAAAAAQAAAAGPQAPLELETVLSRVRQAVQGSHPLWQASANSNVSPGSGFRTVERPDRQWLGAAYSNSVTGAESRCAPLWWSEHASAVGVGIVYVLSR
jgi:hypothetical protein